MKAICLFTEVVPDGFWRTGTKTSIKLTVLRQYKPDIDLHGQIKKYAQARIPHHGDVMPVWDMIGPGLYKVKELIAQQT